ncbi:uncharacterized protein B0H18DRAFT_881086 [Fomitopsis serialis]|uniref:uncharacterized protein n=1 Tax=Fomitopsis serialis TaxID=139415 RepID=UPI002007B8C1|nr:uncharacterized protein B0H18DRAFT_881086 [Neoantrodia serialis]KAH9920444.1 hypothetical protein B0H18DRAFT_881086 [Neoantrodia serialis]
MRLLPLITFAASLIALASAQGIDIGAPLAGSTISPGQNITVEVDRPNSLTGSEEVAIVISMVPCETSTCNSPNQDLSSELGYVLYNGPYSPQYDSITPPDHKPPYQNFSVQVPSWYTSGEHIALAVTHVSLVGAGPWVLLEFKNVSLVVD